MKRKGGYFIVCLICLFYWIIDSVWSYLSYEDNLKQMIFSEPTSYLDTFLLKVTPYQGVSRIMVIVLFTIIGGLCIEFFVKRQESYKKDEERLRFILDSLPDMVVQVDREMHVKWANKSALRVSSKVVGHTCFESFVGNNSICKNCYCAKAFETGKIEMGVMYQPESKTAGESYWENIGVPLKDFEGNVTSVLEVSRNVTERELSRKRELKLQSQLHHIQKMESVGNLAGGIAHEFNNILSIIIGNNELLMDQLPESGQAFESTQEIKIAGSRARDVVKQLLDFSRSDDVVNKAINIGEVIEGSMKLIRSSTPSNIEIKYIKSERLEIVYANSTQINQILINLCNNAVDAMSDTGGQIIVELSNIYREEIYEEHYPVLNARRYVKLSVCDNGAGMEKEVLDRVFEPYYTTKEMGKGTGIGLAVVHGIVKSLDGLITVDSKPSQGTIFTIFLPNHKGAIEKGRNMPENQPTGNETILYVDDEPSIAKLGKRHLDGLGYKTESTTDPLNALEILRNNPEKFDLVITDMTMPKMTGDQLVVEVKKICQTIPTIICTGYSAKVSGMDTVELGINAIVMKPLDKSELAAVVRNVLDEAEV